MSIKKLKSIFVASLILLLMGCSREVENNSDVNTLDSDSAEEIEEVEMEEEENWEDAVGDIDLAEEDFDEIEWDKVHLTKAQFDDFLNEMRKNYMEVDEEDENDIEIQVLGIEFDGKTIEYIITSADEDNFMTEFAQGMYILMLDGFTRQFYLHSDYSNGEQHPTIIFNDEDGSVITENNDFIEFEEE